MDVNRTSEITRRDCLKTAAASILAGPAFVQLTHACENAATDGSVEPKRVAAILTAYEKGLHADVLVGKILEGWEHDGGAGPALKLASMYVDQFTEKDLARSMSEKYGVPIVDSIADAITLGGKGVAVDGVISVGEHGSYPWNEKEQHLYPRRRFFTEIADTFEKYDCVVPVFNDKHLGPQWEDAVWMYERAIELGVPFMAGSSLPVSFRDPETDVPIDCEIEQALGIGYSGLDIYGAHTLDCLQSLVERRRGGEVGVRWVHCLEGDSLRQAIDDGAVAADLVDAALAAIPHAEGDWRTAAKATLFLFEYADGLPGRVLMLPGYAERIGAAVKLKGEPRPRAFHFVERTTTYPHFAYLLKAIERMVHTGEPSYPVERALLSSGVLDRVLTSRFEGYKKLETPELAIEYQQIDYPHAPKPALNSSPCASL